MSAPVGEVNSLKHPNALPLTASEGAVVPGGNAHGVYISTYGCQMNVNDSERMLALLEMLNYESVSTPEDASLIIINSCSVREKPVHKVHSEVGRYRRLKERNPHLRIGVSGCVAQQEKEKLLRDMPLLDFVIGTDAIDELPEIVQRLRKDETERPVVARFSHGSPYQIQTLVRDPGVSTFVNIMKGCDNFCTFCVVPFTRGRERSRDRIEIVSDVRRLVDRGVREVTLLGQNVNSYRSACGSGFGDLLKTLAEETEIERIRFTTSHPKDFDRDLVRLMQAHRQKIMEYVHLPVQSGSSEILSRMNRGYSRTEYIEKAKMILEEIPGAVLSTDIIVGFPGETEEQFQETLSLLDEVPYENIYAFKYSPRPYTKAARFSDQVLEKVKSERLARLLGRHRVLADQLAERYRGQELAVLVERWDPETKMASGRSTQNKLVHFPMPEDLGQKVVGATLPVLIEKAYPQVLHGVRVALNA